MTRVQRRGKGQHGQRQQERIARVVRQVDHRLELDSGRERARDDRRQQLAGGLDRPLRPAPLLRLERLDVRGQLGRGHVPGIVDEAPAPELRPIAEVEVLGERVVRPAARILDAGTPPDAGRSVEVEEQAAAHPRLVLEQELGVEHDGLGRGHDRAIAVEMAPARLDHPDPGIGEMPRRAQEEVAGRHEVGIEDRHPFPARAGEPGRERPGLVPGPRVAVQQPDVEASRPMARDGGGEKRARLVGGVVQDLDLEALGRIVERRDRVDQPPGDAPLVVDRELHGHDREHGGATRRAPLGPRRRPAPPDTPQRQVTMRRVEHEQEPRQPVEGQRGSLQHAGQDGDGTRGFGRHGIGSGSGTVQRRRRREHTCSRRLV